MLYDNTNELFNIAADFVHYSKMPIFLTGKAGSGKTTFLKYIKAHTVKQTAIAAPTGVAAINAGGVTLHSFFQLPFGSFVPIANYRQHGNVHDRHTLLSRIKMNSERRAILQQLELLIIDEISMVRCDLLDAIDAILRYIRNRQHEPFGGVQVLLIGDMFQLPPVVKDDEKHIVEEFYETPYFFSSRVIQEQYPVCIEFDKIYRQKEEGFISLLNKIRDNRMDHDGFALLNSRMQPAFQPYKDDNAIILTTHNYKADAINAEQLAKLKIEPVLFKAKIDGDFSDKAFPAEETLQLKTGAQVMFIKNDPEKAKRFFNGKIGVIEKMTDETVFIKCKDEEYLIELQREKWENIRYSFNAATQKTEEEVAGSFTQFPLRLAWAITIHKSQGLTFERAIIDAGSAFAPGQVYVALSRCTSLEGIVLKSNITNSGLHNDDRIVAFAKQKKSFSHLQNELISGKKDYQQHIILMLFNFNELRQKIEQVIKIVVEHSTSFNAETQPWLESIEQKINYIVSSANKFLPQLTNFLKESQLPENNNALLERMKVAVNFFIPLLQVIFNEIPSSPAHTDGRQNALAYNEDLEALYIATAKKITALNSCADGFIIDKYHLQKNQFTVKSLNANAYAAVKTERIESPHPLLLKRLRDLREKICEETGLPLYMVAGSTSISDMIKYLPQDKNELLEINGFGKVKVDKFGDRFLDIIIKYAQENSLESVIPKKEPRAKKKQKKTSSISVTKEETYKLYKSGKTITDIAEERKLSPTTIESHLAFYVEKGVIQWNELVSEEKFILIEPVLKAEKFESLSAMKQKFSSEISFNDIKVTLAWIEFEKNQAKPVE